MDFIDLHVFTRIYMDLEGISLIQELGCPATCGGKLWPLYNTMLGPWGFQAGRMVAGWLDSWLAGRLDGGGGHHGCNLARSTPRRVGG